MNSTYQKHREAKLAYRRNYYRTHRTQCLEYAKNYSKRQRQEHPERVAGWRIARRSFKRNLFGYIKCFEGCSRCGFNAHPAALDFHHIGPKKFAIGQSPDLTLPNLFNESLKCKVLCANCHRIEHSTEV
jgi:hypothetical protein